MTILSRALWRSKALLSPQYSRRHFVRSQILWHTESMKSQSLGTTLTRIFASLLPRLAFADSDFLAPDLGLRCSSEMPRAAIVSGVFPRVVQRM